MTPCTICKGFTENCGHTTSAADQPTGAAGQGIPEPRNYYAEAQAEYQQATQQDPRIAPVPPYQSPQPAPPRFVRTTIPFACRIGWHDWGRWVEVKRGEVSATSRRGDERIIGTAIHSERICQGCGKRQGEMIEVSV